MGAILMTTLQQYFGLQLTMFKRQLIEFGLNPIVGIIFILLGFFGFSIYLFTKTEYANYLYIIVALGMVLQYSEINRNDFLKQVQSHLSNNCVLLLMGARDPGLEQFGKEIWEKL